MAQDWAARPLDIDFLVDSGLLAEVNRNILNPFGISLAFKEDEQGRKTFVLKDGRGNPEKVLFGQELARSCRKRFETFLKQFGFAQMERRERHMGKAVQHVEMWT